MRTWVEVWRESQLGKIVYVPSRRSGSGPIAQDRAAKKPISVSSSSGSSSSQVALRGTITTTTDNAVQVKLDGSVKKIVTVVFAGDERYLFKVLAVVEKLRAMKHGKAYRIIVTILGK
jgi:hypothetical protein